MGSKLIGFRCPDDLAEAFEHFCEGAEKTPSEVLRKMVDDLIYPPSAELDSPEQLYGVEATKLIAEQVNVQIKEQLKDQLGDLVNERLELVQIDRGLAGADKEHYDGALAALESELANLKVGISRLVQTVNNSGEVCNDQFVKVARLYQFLSAHIHDGNGAIAVSPEKLLKGEVELADKQLGKIEGLPEIIQGKTSAKGYRYLEHTDFSVREKK